MWGCACAAAVATTRPANAARAQKKKRQIIDLLATAPLLARQISRAQAHDITDCGGMEARNAIAPTWQGNAKSTPPRRRRRRAGHGCLRTFHPDAAPPPRHGP